MKPGGRSGSGGARTARLAGVTFFNGPAGSVGRDIGESRAPGDTGDASRRTWSGRATPSKRPPHAGPLPGGLETVSPRPRHARTPTWTKELENAVLELRQLTPGWGKDKLVVLLRDQGWQCSTSMVGRILRRLKRNGRLVEAPGADPWHPRRPFLRPYGVRKPKEYLADRPGAIVQVDTAHVSLFSGFHFKHFTAGDVCARWQVLEAHGRATAHAAAGFLDTILERMPFPVRAIQVDGGSEFMAQFEAACRARGVKLFGLPPRSRQ